MGIGGVLGIIDMGIIGLQSFFNIITADSFFYIWLGSDILLLIFRHLSTPFQWSACPY